MIIYHVKPGLDFPYMTFYLGDELFCMECKYVHFFGFGADWYCGGCLCRNFKLRILYILDEIIIRAYLAYNILNSDIYPHSSETLRNSSYL